MASPPTSAASATTAPTTTRDALTFPPSLAAPLSPYLPPSPSQTPQTTPPPTHNRPFTTLTFATSLDSSLSLAPGTRTALSGPLSKAMTHHLRSRHDAILIGAGTAIADDPSLNCRIEGVGGYGGKGKDGLAGQPRPVVVDARGRWEWWCPDADEGEKLAKVLQLAHQGRGRAPWVLVGAAAFPRMPSSARSVLEAAGGRLFSLPVGPDDGAIAWADIFALLAREGVRSVMVEGGAGVINKLLEPGNMGLLDSVIVTIAPTWLGQGGVVVSPERRWTEQGARVEAARLRDVRWCPMGEDVVLCGRLGG